MVLEADDLPTAMRIAVRSARQVLRSYSTSFYLVTRFLPSFKRSQVELIYAAVRFPDELVDTFATGTRNVEDELDRWESNFSSALESNDLIDSCKHGLNPYVSAFAEVVKKHQIPPDYYYSFLQTMRSDLSSQTFRSAEELIDGYVYGSATVVGYFLTYVYGTEKTEDFSKALSCARELAIALQLTNFARDLREDCVRGRYYFPLDQFSGSEVYESKDPEIEDELLLAARIWLASEAQRKYALASEHLDLFCEDSRSAMECCIKVYSLLNEQILESSSDLHKRMSVPWYQKFAALPASKFWRLPLAYAGFM